MVVEKLKSWFHKESRELPFRQKRTAYRVWVSEVMLQQTQASVVVPYFERWMEAFPTVEDLAKASIERVLKLWEGLGYYSRARNLHKGAQEIAKRGSFPDDLESITGIGPYTAGAIRSFAWKEKAAAVDGNVLRVMARYLGEEGEIDKLSTQKRLKEAVERFLPDDDSWIAMEALIELGALVCKRKPLCHRCPLSQECQAFRHALALPNRSKRTQAIKIERTVAVVVSEDHLLLERGERGKVMADLYQFPYLEGRREWSDFDFGFPLIFVKPLPIERHSFTKYRATLYPYLFHTKIREKGEWKKKSEMKEIALSSGHKRIYENLT